jgi:lipopolysaccharide exporter
LTGSGNSLSSRALKGGFWVFSLRIADRLFKLIRTIILARILSPNDFGLFGVALLVLSMLKTSTESGFQHALIQKKGETKSFLDTAWTMGLIRGFIIATVIFFIAKPATIFFDAPSAEPILRVIGASIILHSLTNISVLYFQKELEFKKYFKYQFSGTISDVIVAITSALLLRSVWALVFGLLAGNLVSCIMSYVIEPYKPKIRFSIKHAKGLFSFGKWILGSGILVFLITHGDDIFVGKILGVTMLAFYQMAYKISNLPAGEISNVISQVSFPAYSKLQDNLKKLKEAYLKILKLTSFISFPVAGLIFILAPDFTRLFLGEQWLPMVPTMQVLALWGLIRSIDATTGPLFYGLGKPKFATYLNLGQFVLIASLIYPFSLKYGILGAAIAIVLSAFITNAISLFMVMKLIDSKAIEFFKILLLPTINIIIMVFIIYLSKINWHYSSNLWGIFIIFTLGISGVIVYFCISCFFGKFLNYNILDIIKRFNSKK